MISAYHRLFEIEKSFRMSKHDLQARPIYHHQRDSIEAHLTVVFAALAVSRWIEARTGWSIRKFVKTARRYRTVEIRPASTPSPPPTHCPTTCAAHSTASTEVQVRTRLSQVRSPMWDLAGGWPSRTRIQWGRSGRGGIDQQAGANL